MTGVVVFHSVAEAIKAGFAVYDKTPEGYLVRNRTANGYAFALVVLKK